MKYTELGERFDKKKTVSSSGVWLVQLLNARSEMGKVVKSIDYGVRSHLISI